MDEKLAHDMDALHVLPLSIIPLQTRVFSGAKLIKNARLQTVIELFSDKDSGSGQMSIENAVRDLREKYDAPPEDITMLRKLSRLHSYDVYSLRVLLRENDIPMADNAALKLSPEKSRELGAYMKDFTMPLIREIYGTGDVNVKSFDDLIQLFRNPDVSMARDKLDQMARKLDIHIMELPRFLEDYGDIFLSLAYYKKCMAEIEPIERNFLDSLKALRSNWEMRSNQSLMQTCEVMEKTFAGLSAQIKRLFDEFDKSSNDFWKDVSATRFREVEGLIESYHTTIGGVLCALSVKMSAWDDLFPKKSIGGPVKRSEFIMTDMRQGMDVVRNILKDTRDSKITINLGHSKFRPYEPLPKSAEKKITS